MQQIDYKPEKKFSFPSIDEMKELLEYAKLLAQVPNYCTLGGPGGIFAVLLTARELDIGLMFALNGGIFNIPGRVSKTGVATAPKFGLAAQTMSMMIRREGHTVEQIALDDTHCILKGIRHDTNASLTINFTIQTAMRAGLVKDFSPWITNVQDMLWKSALSKLARRLFPDVIGNCYGEFDFPEAEVEDETEKKERKIRSKRSIQEEFSPELIKEPVKEIDYQPEIENFLKEIGYYQPDSLAKDQIEQLAMIKECQLPEAIKHAFENQNEFRAALSRKSSR